MNHSPPSMDPPVETARTSPSAANRVSPETSEFIPIAPENLEQTGLSSVDVESLILKYLLNTNAASGRNIAEQIRLPFFFVKNILSRLKDKLLVAYCGSAPMSDYEYELTDAGRQRGRHFHENCSYCGAAPVSLQDYVDSIAQQTIRNAKLRIADLCNAFSDLHLPPAVLGQIGQAVNDGRGLFLHGPPGNGKTSIAERLIRAIQDDIWIPRTINFGGHIMRVFDPSSHEERPSENDVQLLSEDRIDRRWVRIRRPTVLVGGELTLEHLEVTYNPATGIAEAPLQLKSNGGALVFDDFGRQRVSLAEFLNRWIVPLEKGFDYLTLPSGRQLKLPVDQLTVFATNLDPAQIVDEAFLRRIPYKVELCNPSEEDFRLLVKKQAQHLQVQYDAEAVEHLIRRHYQGASRPMRYCHPRELIMQVRSLCEFQDRPAQLSAKAVDMAVANYFGMNA